jgi:HK97 family phage prohead protease
MSEPVIVEEGQEAPAEAVVDEQPVEAPPEPSTEIHTFSVVDSLELRDLDKREIGAFIVPWNVTVPTAQGLEEFQRGAFTGTDPARVKLRMEHQNPVAGKGVAIEERADGAHMVFRVSKTAKGDEILTLAADGVTDGVSVGFFEVPGGTVIEQRSGRRVRVHRRVDLREVSTTWQPVYERAAVQYVRSKTSEEAPMPETQAPAEGATEDQAPAAPVMVPTMDLGPLERAFGSFSDSISERLGKIEERYRSDFQVQAPGKTDEHTAHKGDWARLVVRALSGERIPDMEMRALADVITTDNLGVVPEAFINEMIGVIDPSRPFLSTTRRLPLPSAGMTINVPVITQRPTTGVQSTEKSEISNQKTIITSTGFEAVTIAGGADISVQVLRRSSPSYLDLFLELLGEAYAMDAEDQALLALIAAINDGGPEPAGPLDPEDLSLGAAFVASFNATRRPPDTIWLSTSAVGEFIDAKASTTNQPLYPGLQASATAAGGITGTISGLRPVHVPTLDAKGAYAIVGPSSGFAWTEDGTFTMQVDNPALAGRDVALVGILWSMPLYPAAFTLYNVAS